MRIGIAFDTKDMYNIGAYDELYRDFADVESINSLKCIIDSLGHKAIMLGNTDNVSNLIKSNRLDCDLVYNTVEGIKSRNREGLLPALLEINNIPYIGTDAFGLSLTLDKNLTKILAEKLSILTPKYFVISSYNTPNYIKDNLNKLCFPVIIKPNFEGNSSGIFVCNTIDTAIERIIYMLNAYKTTILCEEFIYGQEITVPLIGNSPSNMFFGVTTVDIQKTDDFWLDVDIKVHGDYSNVILELPDAKKQEFKDISLKLFREIGCRDFARFDFRLAKTGKIYFIEVNPLPSLFIGGSFDVVGRHYGYTFAKTIQLIIETACERLSIPKT